MIDYNNLTVANCKISKPILYPDHQDVQLNGLAFSATMGMIHQINYSKQQDWKTWLGTQA